MKHYVLGFYIIFDYEERTLSGLSGREFQFITGAPREVLLIEKVKPDWQYGLFNGHGGSVEAGETTHRAMVREFHEETGIETDENDWRYAVTVADDDYRLDVFAVYKDFLPSYMPKCDEGTNKVFRLTNLPRTMEPTARWCLALCLDTSLHGKVVYNSTFLADIVDYIEGSEAWVDHLRDEGTPERMVEPYAHQRGGAVEIMRDIMKVPYRLEAEDESD